MNKINFSLAELKAFLATARIGTFTDTSAQLNISQSALSRRISLIERAVGTPLFDRFANGVRLTEAGQELLPHAQAALAALQDGTDAVQGVIHGQHDNVTLAAIGALCNATVIEAFREFRDEFPQTELSLSFHAGTSDEVSDMVLRGDVSFGLRYRMDSDPRLKCDVMGTERMLIVCSPRHSLAARTTVTPAEIAEETWIAFPVRAGATDAEFRRRLSWYGLASSRAVMLMDSTAGQKRLIEANFGIGLLPQGHVREALQAGTLHALDVTGMRTQVPVTLVQRHGSLASDASTRIAALLTQRFGSP